MTMRDYLTERQRFFWDHAGYSYDPAEETEDQGHAGTAMALARAERRLARRQDAEVEWEYDMDPWAGDVEWDGPVYVATLVRYDGSRLCLGSLGNIAMPSLDDPYRRVVEAELADEYL